MPQCCTASMAVAAVPCQAKIKHSGNSLVRTQIKQSGAQSSTGVQHQSASHRASALTALWTQGGCAPPVCCLASPHAKFTVQALASLTAQPFTERTQPEAPSFVKRSFSVPARHEVLVPYLVSQESAFKLAASCAFATQLSTSAPFFAGLGACGGRSIVHDAQPLGHGG